MQSFIIHADAMIPITYYIGKGTVTINYLDIRDEWDGICQQLQAMTRGWA